LETEDRLKIGRLDFPEDLFYTNEHEWLKVEEDLTKIGITDYAQDSLHEIVFCDLPEVGTSIDKGSSLGTVESIKAVSDVYSPISGTVIEVNERLVEEPELLNNSPYKEGWIVLLKPDSIDELEELLNVQTYTKMIEKILSE
jgi:glycine cleavage system H protein